MCKKTYSLFILVMCILLQLISNPLDFVKYLYGKMSLLRKELIAQKLLHGKIKKVFSRAHVCSLEQRARNAHDQNEQILLSSLHLLLSLHLQHGIYFIFILILRSPLAAEKFIVEARNHFFYMQYPSNNTD